METNPEKAVRLHAEGCNCAQAVLGAFCEKYGLDRATALRLSGGLGGGMRCGEVCGAASGSVLVIGLRHGAAEPADKAKKEACGKKTAEFIAAFRERHGSCVCRELLKASGRKICDELIRSAAEALDRLGY